MVHSPLIRACFALSQERTLDLQLTTATARGFEGTGTYTLEGLNELKTLVRRHDVLGQNNGLSVLVGAVLADQGLHV